MASKAMKIGGGGKDKKKPTVSQSIPAHFYRNYVPPKTPKINPQPQPSNIPDFAALPKISGGVGINLQKSGSYSMNKNRHPMSMPAPSGMMGPRGTPFTVSNPSFTKGVTTANEKASKEPELSEHKEEQLNDDGNSLVERTQKLKIGSFTCLDMMGGGVSKLREVREREDNKGADVASATSATSASTFASDVGNDVAPEPESDEDDAAFDMD